jgi:PAS domain S-box-containing protein
MSTNQTIERHGFRLTKRTLLPAWVRKLFAAPVFEGDDEKTRVARLLNIVLFSMLASVVVTIGLPLALYGFPTTLEDAYTPAGAIIVFVLMVGLIALARRGFLEIASVMLLATLWVFIAIWIYAFSTAPGDASNMIYVLIIVLAGLLLGQRGAIAFTILSLLSVLGAFAGGIAGASLETIFDLAIIFVVVGLVGSLQGYAVNSMTNALDLARRSKNALAERTHELEASQRVTFAASERVSPDDLLNLVVNLIRDQFNLYHVQVYIVEPPLTSSHAGETAGRVERERMAVLRKSTGYAGRQLLQKKHRIPLDRPALVTKAIREGEPVLVADVKEDPNFMPNPLLPDTRSELVVPLKVGDRTIGVLDVQDRTPGRFTKSTVALFQMMTDQVAFLFENSELIERVSEQAQALTLFTNQLRAAADIAHKLGTILDPDLLLQQVVELMQSRFGLYHAHIYVLDETTNLLTVRAGSGEVGQVLCEREHSILLRAEKSLVARAARERETMRVNDTSLEPDFMPNPLLPQTRSEMAVPLVVGEHVLGVLDVQDDRINRFTQSDLDTFSTLAGQIATALQNAQLFEARERATEALREREEQYRTLVEHAPEAIVVFDIETGQFVDVNDNAVKLFGYEREELIGMSPDALSPPTQPDGRPSGEIGHIQKALDGKTPVFEFIQRNAAGEDFPCEVRLVRLPSADRKLIRGSIIDITERVRFEEERARAEEALRETTKRLREMDRLKSEFLANMSHELRTPLNSIIGYSEIMLMGIDGSLDPETLEDVQSIYENSQHLLRLINDILDLAKIEAGRLALEFEKIEVEPLIEKVSRSIAGLLINKPVELIVEVEENLVPIQADRVRLSQVLSNIASNAAKFTDEGTVILRAFADRSHQGDDGWICFEVEDTGIGISEADLERIFERFQQVDGSNARRADGTGLGLAITRHLVQMHGGTVEARSQPGEGTTFTVRLPVRRQVEAIAGAVAE